MNALNRNWSLHCRQNSGLVGRSFVGDGPAKSVFRHPDNVVLVWDQLRCVCMRFVAVKHLCDAFSLVGRKSRDVDQRLNSFFGRPGDHSPRVRVVADVLSTSTVVNAHSHSANVPASDQLHPADTNYTSSSSLSHVHMVTLSANQLSTIASGSSVTVTSTVSTVTGTHTHDFTFQGKK